MKHSKFIHLKRDFYKCEVTRWIYQFIGCKYDNIYKFTLIRGKSKHHIVNKYKKDVIRAEGTKNELEI